MQPGHNAGWTSLAAGNTPPLTPKTHHHSNRLAHWAVVKLPLVAVLPIVFLRRRKDHRLNRIYSAMTVFGTFLGTLVVLLAAAGSYGTSRDVVRVVSGINSNIVVMLSRVGDVCDMPRVLDIIQTNPHVIAASPYVLPPEVVVNRSDDATPVPILLKGVDPDRELEATDLGQSIEPDVLRKITGEYREAIPVVLSQQLATQLALAPGSGFTLTLKNPTGDTNFSARLVGTFRPETSQLSRFAYTSLLAARLISKVPEPCVKGITVRTDDPYLAPGVARSLSANLGEHYRVRDWTDQFRDYWASLMLMRRLVAGLNIGVIFLAITYSFSTVLLVAHEKRKELAILLSLGMSPRSIRWMFVNLSLILGLVGIGLAAVAVRPACWAMNHYQLLRLPAGISVVSHVSFRLPILRELLVYLAELALLSGYGWLLSSDIGRISVQKVLHDE
jgi:lipoprotein-releasing system permease protein